MPRGYWLLLLVIWIDPAQLVFGQETLPPPRDAKVERDKNSDRPLHDLPLLALRPGEWVSIRKYNENQAIRGVFVYQDLKHQQILLRTTPGAAPVAYDIRSLEKIESDQPNSPPANEIHTLTIYNGPIRHESYYAPTLSPQERAPLAKLQQAGAELAQREELMLQLADSLRIQTTPHEYPWMPYPLPSAVVTYSNTGYGLPGFLNSPFFGFGNAFPLQYGQVTTQFFPPAPNIIERPGVNVSELVKALSATQEQANRARLVMQAMGASFLVDDQGHLRAVLREEK